MLWGVLDGALDAGACEDGMTEDERRTLSPICEKLCQYQHASRQRRQERG